MKSDIRVKNGEKREGIKKTESGTERKGEEMKSLGEKEKEKRSIWGSL